MGGRGGRGRVDGGGALGGTDRVRTHMMFSDKAKDKSVTKKRKRGRHNKLQHRLHQHDAMIQTGESDDLDPTEWTGNQRVVHFGPMGQRDPFFYYYPKGWDILYPASFGFFPYRTNSPTVCLTAFGTFMTIGGLGMCWLGFLILHPERRPWDRSFEADPIGWLANIPPLQIAGPIFLLLGLLGIMLGVCGWFWGLNLFSERLRHRQPHNKPPRRTVHQCPLPEMVPQETATERNPYAPPPPPAFTLLSNPHTEQFLYTTESEMKLYPPVMPGYSSLSLAQSSAYIGSPYNTLGSARAYAARGRSLTTTGLEGIIEQWPEYHGNKYHHKHFDE